MSFKPFSVFNSLLSHELFFDEIGLFFLSFYLVFNVQKIRKHLLFPAVNVNQSAFAFGSTSWDVLARTTLATLKRRCCSFKTTEYLTLLYIYKFSLVRFYP